ncbi:Uncharacterised protein [Candidatus Burarchaeum australiense]|nr:Uncharacterised protein [Candidatus Burarchaeum australiense]
MASLDALRSILRDEMLQVLATGFIALTLIGMQVAVDDFLVRALGAASGQDYADIGSAMGAASSRVSALADATAASLASMSDASVKIGDEASKGIFCNFLGTGFTLVNCSPLNAFRGSLTSAGFATSVALADTYAQMFILSLAQSFSFTFLIPLGIFLRCFKVSRQAGGALIAIGFGFYTVYPIVILATDSFLHGAVPHNPVAIPQPGTCDPAEADNQNALGAFRDYSNSLTDFNVVQPNAYYSIVRVLFMSILNLIITIGFIRTFAHIIGSEIDVSALARIS